MYSGHNLHMQKSPKMQQSQKKGYIGQALRILNPNIKKNIFPALLIVDFCDESAIKWSDFVFKISKQCYPKSVVLGTYALDNEKISYCCFCLIRSILQQTIKKNVLTYIFKRDIETRSFNKVTCFAVDRKYKFKYRRKKFQLNIIFNTVWNRNSKEIKFVRTNTYNLDLNRVF